MTTIFDATPMHLLASAPGLSGGAPATTGEPGGPAGGGQAPPQSPFGGQFLFIMLGVLMLMILMSTMSGRKEKKKRAEMLASIGRHDRVQTAGGMIGTVVEVRDDEIVLKVDESNNTKIHFARSAVQSVLKSANQREPSAAEAETAETALQPAERIA